MISRSLLYIRITLLLVLYFTKNNSRTQLAYFWFPNRELNSYYLLYYFSPSRYLNSISIQCFRYVY